MTSSDLLMVVYVQCWPAAASRAVSEPGPCTTYPGRCPPHSSAHLLVCSSARLLVCSHAYMLICFLLHWLSICLFCCSSAHLRIYLSFHLLICFCICASARPLVHSYSHLLILLMSIFSPTLYVIDNKCTYLLV
jgi:hypothetical protein